jgi:hypothetical protein
MDVKKMTALEYFLMGIYDLKIIKLDDNDKINQLSDLYHESLAMEKEQIMKAARQCHFEGLRQTGKNSEEYLKYGNDYYNETFNK